MYALLPLCLVVVALALIFSGWMILQNDAQAVSSNANANGLENSASAERVVVPECEYSYSDWGDCGERGVQMRTVVNRKPNECRVTRDPVLEQRCTYVRESVRAPQCAYAYATWSECGSNGQQTRSVIAKTPKECEEYDPPTVKQSCTYTAPVSAPVAPVRQSAEEERSRVNTTAPSTTSTQKSETAKSESVKKSTGSSESAVSVTKKNTETPSAVSSAGVTNESRTASGNASGTTDLPQCGYVYSDWGRCSASKQQMREVISRTPQQCREYEAPVLRRVCDSSVASVEPVVAEKAGAVAVSNITPEFEFIGLPVNSSISGSFEIDGRVDQARKVEYSLVPIDSNVEKYVGSAYMSIKGTWVYGFDTTRFPNGAFYLQAKIQNAYGTYVSNRLRVNIDNVIVREVPAQERTTKPEEGVETVEENFNGSTSNEWQSRYFGDERCSKKNVCGSGADPDKDDLSNGEEFRLGTDPNNPDSDRDGYLDGDEIKNQFDPLKASPGDKRDSVVFQSPKDSGEVKQDTYRVSDIAVVEQTTGRKGLKISGKGIPNSFLTVYVYSSSPIILTVQTDADGNWSYTLDKDLEDGDHQVYVAVTDNIGQITAKSEPLAFVKTAEAVSVIPTAEASDPSRVASPLERRSNMDMFFLVAIMLSGLAGALVVIGLIRHGLHHS